MLFWPWPLYKVFMVSLSVVNPECHLRSLSEESLTFTYQFVNNVNKSSCQVREEIQDLHLFTSILNSCL